MPSSEPSSKSRWACRFAGCEKSFARKEHLTRHERTHASKDSLFVCKVCLQKFNRSDSLQRHLARHGDAYKPRPSGRSKKACITCHKAKIKCDGSHPCSKCRSKGTACRYEQAEELAIVSSRETSLENAEKETISQIPSVRAHSPQDVEISSFFHAGPLDLNSLELGPRQNSVVTSPRPTTAQPPQSVPPMLKHLNGKHLIDLTSIRICKDPGPSTEETPFDDQAEVIIRARPSILPEGVEERYLELYFTHFHHRWPIVHRPAHAHNDGNDKLLFKFCMLMIGGWLSGTGEGKEYALAMYDYLVPHISNLLSQKTSADVFQDTLPSSLCQAAVATIVFALQTGAETRISKAVMLRNTLIAVLREVGFFDPGTLWADEKPGFFIALHLSLLGERQRLAAYLFRVDIYLSMVRGHRSLMSFHELHYSLPSTYAIWNADGLHVFANRLETEPPSRNQTSMWTRIRDVEQGTEIPMDEPMLIEDIQLLMCVIQPRVAHFWNRMRSSCFNDPAILRAECPRPRLEALKRQLDLIFLQLKNSPDPGTNETLPSIHYHGYEEPTEPGFDKIVSGRMKDQLFDALMLSHLLQIQLSTDIQLFSQISKDRNVPLGMELSEARRQEREQRVTSATTWTTTCLARRALYHAAEVLVLHRENREIDTRTMDPIAIVALVNAALVVMAYCIFSGAKAPDESDPPGSFHTELTEWCNWKSPNKGAREMWINMAVGLPVEIEHVRLCSANVGYFKARFRAFIPEGWELADIIAPGISKEWV